MGKTNLLEAVYLTAVGRSPRTLKDKELINHDSSKAKVAVFAQKSYGVDRVEIVVDRNANKRVAINGLPLTKMGELMGVVRVVFFSPDEMSIVKDGPANRRRLMDIALCQLSRQYFYLCNRYNRVLAQRNRLLKGVNPCPDALDIWDAQLADLGAVIIKTRRGFVAALSEAARRHHSFLSDGGEDLRLVYESLDGLIGDEIGGRSLDGEQHSGNKISKDEQHSGKNNDLSGERGLDNKISKDEQDLDKDSGLGDERHSGNRVSKDEQHSGKDNSLSGERGLDNRISKDGLCSCKEQYSSSEQYSSKEQHLSGDTPDQIAAIKSKFLGELKKSRAKDLRLGFTSCGPHKDDIGIYIGGIDARRFASQGQQRTAALSIKLAEVDLAADKGEPPILLLDDVMGELDLNRQKKLLKKIKGMQAIITCTHFSEEVLSALGDYKEFKISNGTVL